MKKTLEVGLGICVAVALAAAQEPSKPVMHAGIHVHLPSASHAVEMKSADDENATVVSLSNDGGERG